MAPITRRKMTLHSTIIIQLRAPIAHFHCVALPLHGSIAESPNGSSN